MKIVAFGGSTSKNSINGKFARYVASLVEDAEVDFLDLNDFEMPIFNVDREKSPGVPKAAYAFRKHIEEADGIIISLAEHNGSYSAAFKNILDWVSRIDRKVWMERPMLLMAATPGGRGGKSVLDAALNYFPRLGATIVATFSLPSFRINFSESGLLDQDLSKKLHQVVQEFEAAVMVEKS